MSKMITGSKAISTHLKVNCKCRHLLRQTKKIDRSIEKTGFKFGFEIDWTTTTEEMV